MRSKLEWDRERRLIGMQYGGVAWVADGRWLARAEFVELEDHALSAAFHGEPWQVNECIEYPPPFAPEIATPLPKNLEAMKQWLADKADLVEFRYSGLTVGDPQIGQTALYLAPENMHRWISTEFIIHPWRDCRVMGRATPTGTVEREKPSLSSALRFYGSGPDMLMGIVMPMNAPAVTQGPFLERGAETLAAYIATVEAEPQC